MGWFRSNEAEQRLAEAEQRHDAVSAKWLERGVKELWRIEEHNEAYDDVCDARDNVPWWRR